MANGPRLSYLADHSLRAVTSKVIVFVKTLLLTVIGTDVTFVRLLLLVEHVTCWVIFVTSVDECLLPS